jgi:SpoVK/Ycf46/Vps4 family AAA+-type ATPase
MRFRCTRLFDEDHPFARSAIVSLSPTGAFESPLSGALMLGSEYRRQFTTGLKDRPGFNTDFPAVRIQVGLGWEALVLPPSTLDQLGEIKSWILHRDQLLHDWEMGPKLRPGFTCLFHGPPGTGKTLSACLLGQHCGCDVYKIDLSMIVSKYIGETEKNLAKLFDRAEEKGWILFFDEADALFGRRTRVESSHDRYANQESSFLLQRIEQYAGVVILASNLKTNIDDAFLRRFDSIISFPMPRPDERLRIWKNAFPAKAILDGLIDISRLAEKHEISGGTIMNVVRYVALRALSRGENVIRLEDLEEGIRRECMKEGRML